MKISTPVKIGLALLVVAIVAFGADALYNAKVRAEVKLAVALERARVAEEQVSAVNARLDDIAESNAALEAKLEASEAAAAAREAELLARLNAIHTATPTQLVDEGARLLDANDITTDGNTVTMGLETYRKVVFQLVEREDLVKVQKPAWNAKEELYKAQISGYKASEILHAQKDASNEEIKKELRSVISKQKGMTILEKGAWAAGGFVAGSLASKLK
jgi:hypothetical protein